MKKWTLLFTPKNVVVAKISGTLGVALSSFGGVVGELERASIKSKIKKVSDEASSLSVKDILSEDDENFTIPVSEIKKVEMKKGGLLSPYKIIFHTPDKEYSFNIIERNRFNEYVEMIKQIFPKKSS
jgi:hypothetical protein